MDVPARTGGDEADGGEGARLDIDVAVDVTIVGGGLVGRPLALALAAQGARVALIDRAAADDVARVQSDGRSDERSAETHDAALDARCTAFSAGSLDWLAAHGLWRADAALAAPIRGVQVSHRGRFGATRIDARELSRDSLGATVDNAAFVASLDPALDAADGVQRFDGLTVAAVEPEEGATSLALGLARRPEVRRGRVRTRLLVVADGAGSSTRGLLGIDVRRTDHDQLAVLGGVALERDHAGIAHERFTASGPLALLPRPGRTMSFVMCIDPEERGAVEALDDAGFLALLQERFGRRLGRFTRTGRRTCVPLQRVEAVSTRGHRALLLGNAARLLHPVAGQGYNLALRDVGALVALLKDKPDPGADWLLERFERERRDDRRRTVTLTDGLARTFRGRAALPGRLRAAGLVGLDLAGPARRAFARASAGL